MRLMELCLSPDLGGLELYMYRCCRELGSRCERVQPVVSSGSCLEERLLREGFAPSTIRRRSRALPLFAASALAKMIDRQAIDLIHIHWTRDIPLAALAKGFSKRKPKIISTRQMKITRSKRDLYHEYLYRQIDLHITITQRLADEMREHLNPTFSDRIVPLYHGVAPPTRGYQGEERLTLRRELGVADTTFLVGLFGRIKPFKGQHLLVDALEKGLANGEDVAGVIVGHAMESDYLVELKGRVERAGLSRRVKFLDFVEEPQRLMQLCDAVVLTTIEETFGLVLAEAMRAGVAVVGSDRGGVPEIIDDGNTGLLFRSGDSPSLYEKLTMLWRDRELCHRLAEAGRASADERFDEASHFRSLHKLLQSLLE